MRDLLPGVNPVDIGMHSSLTVAGAAVAFGPYLGHHHHIPSFIPKRFAPMRGTLPHLFAAKYRSGSSGFATSGMSFTALCCAPYTVNIAISCG